MTTPSDLYLAHCAADHQFAAGDTHDILPGIDPTQAIETARRIIAGPYHDDCPTCHPAAMTPAAAHAALEATTGDPTACPVCGIVGSSRFHPCRFGAPRGLCTCWRGDPAPCLAARANNRRWMDA